MNPSRVFILRPVATALLTVGLLLAGSVNCRSRRSPRSTIRRCRSRPRCRAPSSPSSTPSRPRCWPGFAGLAPGNPAQGGCRPPCEPASRARPRPSRPRWRRSRCCSWPRSSASTSSWEYSTRASWHPIPILSTLPSAGVGAILALQLSGSALDVIALIGILLLVGLVKKNAIMMIDFALDAQRRRGKPALEAITEACLLRFRPIMMTTMAALLGGLPIALDFGTGGELRRPLGLTIVGGLIVSQLLTVHTTPVVYLYLERLRLALGGRVHSRKAPP